MSRYDWDFTLPWYDCDIKDKTRGIQHYISYMLNRTQSMFIYGGLPETLPQRELELMLQTKGYIAIPIPSKVEKLDGKIYAFGEGAYLGGERDVYYMPTICTIASPALDWSANLKIGEECVVIPNDSMYMGLMPMFSRYASLMTENDISMYLADVNTRIVDFISAPDDRTKKGAEQFLRDIVEGKLGVIADNSFLDGIKTQPSASSSRGNTITQLIELQQYLKAGWFNDIGLNANYNMKRESINSTEAELNDDALLPLVLDMLECRKRGIEEVNKKCGTNISVELAASWKVRAEEQENALDNITTEDNPIINEEVTDAEIN